MFENFPGHLVAGAPLKAGAHHTKLAPGYVWSPHKTRQRSSYLVAGQACSRAIWSQGQGGTHKVGASYETTQDTRLDNAGELLGCYLVAGAPHKAGASYLQGGGGGGPHQALLKLSQGGGGGGGRRRGGGAPRKALSKLGRWGWGGGGGAPHKALLRPARAI